MLSECIEVATGCAIIGGVLVSQQAGGDWLWPVAARPWAALVGQIA